MRHKKPSVGCAWIDEFTTTVHLIDSKEGYQKRHHKFIDQRIKHLAEQPVRAKANIAPYEKSARTQANIDPYRSELHEYFGAIKQAVLEKHRNHHF